MTTITGTIHHIGDTETIGSKGFTKRLIVIKTAAQYDGLIPIEAKKDANRSKPTSTSVGASGRVSTIHR